MIRTRKPLPDLEGYEPVWSDLRDQLYRFALTHFISVGLAYEHIPGDGTRIRELWRPIGAVLWDLGVGEEEIATIYKFFLQGVQSTKHEPTAWESRLLEVLQEEAGRQSQPFELTAAKIVNLMGIEGDKQPSNKWAGDILSRYHLYQGKGRTKIGGKKETTYQFEPARVIELCSLYLREDSPDEKVSEKNGDTPRNDLSPVSPGDNVNDSNGFEGTRENQETCPHLSLSGEEGHGGHGRTRPPEMTCKLYHADNIVENVRGQQGQENQGGIAEKFSPLFSGEEVDL